MIFEQWLGYPISLWSNIVWQWCRIRRTLTQYSVSVATGQPDTHSNIVCWWCRIRRTLTQYSVSVATGQPDIQCNIVWQWCQIRWTLTEDLVGVATGQPYTHPILYGHCVGIGRHQQDILRAVVSEYMDTDGSITVANTPPPIPIGFTEHQWSQVDSSESH